jgi:hypothetical protein
MFIHLHLMDGILLSKYFIFYIIFRLIMQDTPEYDAKNAVSFEFVTKVNPGGILSKVLQGTRLPPDVPVNILHSIEEGQLEKYMNTAKSTNSGLEYRLLLNLYVQHLVEDGMFFCPKLILDIFLVDIRRGGLSTIWTTQNNWHKFFLTSRRLSRQSWLHDGIETSRQQCDMRKNGIQNNFDM